MFPAWASCHTRTLHLYNTDCIPRISSFGRCVSSVSQINLARVQTIHVPCGSRPSQLHTAPNLTLSAQVRAAVLAREKQMDECSQLLQDHARANPKTALRVQLTLAQIQLSQGDRYCSVACVQHEVSRPLCLGVHFCTCCICVFSSCA